MKKSILILTVMLCTLLLSGCDTLGRKETKIRDLEFVVVSESAIPENLFELLEEMKGESFHYVYSDREYLYICVGYGAQKHSGYSIAVDGLYLTDKAIHAETTLIGPDGDNLKRNTPSYPYIVLKTDYLEQTVIIK
ncbi:MAG: protease complex subunit PrcB family protein [Lachnospiraceae bacterium]|nr:protease complex subunit PrcB family protein [Lachnospiraceae bacterium]